MTVLYSEKILRAVYRLRVAEERDRFTEREISTLVGVSDATWEADYAPIVCGMLVERPADAPDSGARFREVFTRPAADEVQLTEYGSGLIAKMFQHGERSSETLELPRVQPAPDEQPDGLRAWQAATVRLWGNSTEGFAELSVGWLPADADDGPWVARLYCGDRANDGWIEDVQVIKAHSPQQALQRLWDRAKARHGLFADDPRLPMHNPTDYPTDLWLTTYERVMIDRVTQALVHKAPKMALTLVYHPERRPEIRWMGIAHPATLRPAEATLHDVSGATFGQTLNALLHELDTKFKTGELEQLIDPAMRELMERKTDIGISRSRLLELRKTMQEGEPTDPAADPKDGTP